MLARSPSCAALKLGELAGGSPHGVVVSLPSIQDVVSYETGDAACGSGA